MSGEMPSFAIASYGGKTKIVRFVDVDFEIIVVSNETAIVFLIILFVVSMASVSVCPLLIVWVSELLQEAEIINVTMEMNVLIKLPLTTRY